MDDASTQKRRSTRIVQAVPITVSGVDALGQPFKERTTTVMVNFHGCKYQSKHYVPKNSTIKLEIPRPDPSLPARLVQGQRGLGAAAASRPRTFPDRPGIRGLRETSGASRFRPKIGSGYLGRGRSGRCPRRASRRHENRGRPRASGQAGICELHHAIRRTEQRRSFGWRRPERSTRRARRRR